MNDSDGFFGSGSSDQDASRPKAVNPTTGREQTWQRASNYASPLDNPHGLIKWKLRELVKGLSLRPDLARMLLTGAVIEDNSKADQIIEAAHAMVALDAKANNGTAVHTALSRSFLGHETPAEYMPHVSAFAAELKRNGLTPVATEIRLLCVQLGVIGHTDWIVKTSDGRYLVLDVKTGRITDARKFSVQCKAYAAAEYIDDGKGGWIPIPFAIDQTESVLAHVDPDTGATSLYRVDLRLGFYGAVLAENVRNWAKIEVLSPYVPVPSQIPVSGALHPEHASLTPQTGANLGTVDQAALQSSMPPAQVGQRVDESLPGSEVVTPQYAAAHPDLYQPNGVPIPAVPDFVCRFDGKAASAHPIDIPGQFHCISPQPHAALTNNEAFAKPAQKDPGDDLRKPTEWLHHLGRTDTIQADADGVWCKPMPLKTFQHLYPAPQEANTGAEHAATAGTPGDVESEKAELLKLDKAALQQMMKTQHGGTDLAHNREWLACWIIAKRRGMDDAAATMYAKSKGQMALGVAAPFAPAKTPDLVGPDGNPRPSTEPERQAGDLSFIFKSIEGAKSEGAILALRDNIVERRGDQAWTDEMADAAKRRVTELLAASGNAVDEGLRRTNQILLATEQGQIAQIWAEVTINGSAEENWTSAMQAAAEAQMAKIQAEQPAPPVNPFGQPTS